MLAALVLARLDERLGRRRVDEAPLFVAGDERIPGASAERVDVNGGAGA